MQQVAHNTERKYEAHNGFENEKVGTKEMMNAIRNMEADDKGKSIIGASIETLKMADGKNKKGDIFMSNLEEALAALKLLVNKAIEVANANAKQKPKNINSAEKWKFQTFPLEQFDKTLDDVYISFLMWGRKDAENKKSRDECSGSSGKVFNVSKSFRRLENYAEWMHGTGSDLTEPKLSPESMKKAHDIWKLRASHDKEGHLVWWFDLSVLNLNELKSLAPEESFRYFVWYSHFLMFDEKAQKNGVIVAENVDRLSFWTSLTLIPPKLSSKLNRLTVGVLPVKMKKIYILEAANWLSLLMAIMSPFTSKKMKSRMVLLNKDYDSLVGAVGGNQYALKDFGKSKNGYLTQDNVDLKYFS